ncbi:hypothetical protein BV882_37335 [Streptomyces sp. 46]|nr:hypothetical protein BV882_37335 [Streptomyces sp. 46]
MCRPAVHEGTAVQVSLSAGGPMCRPAVHEGTAVQVSLSAGAAKETHWPSRCSGTAWPRATHSATRAA